MNERWVLTSARCTKWEDRDRLVLVVGAHRTLNDGVKHLIRNIVNHPDFIGLDGFLRDDVALIRTRENIEFNERVQPIQLSTRFIGEDVLAQISGWGFEKFPNHGVHVPHNFVGPQIDAPLSFSILIIHLYLQGDMAETLRYLNVTTLRNQDCRGYLGEFEQQFVLDSIICTDNYEGHGLCHGDTGAALVNLADGKLIATATWGIPCAKGKPDGFTRVGPYVY